ncbi:hypothetical protein HDU97_001111 [Phlyctochytrium planicorne]|nr:hypothetical protein HDU97_001111 [Phlyctochytrium planicorne]
MVSREHCISRPLWEQPYEHRRDCIYTRKCKKFENIIPDGEDYYQVYRTIIVSKLWKLISLDEIPVTNFERAALARKKFTESDKKNVKLLIRLQEMTALKQPESEAPEDRPSDEVKYYLRSHFKAFPLFEVSSTTLPWQEEMMDFKDDAIIESEVSKEFRDAIDGGLALQLYEQRYTHVPKEEEDPEKAKEGLTVEPVEVTGSRPSSSKKPSAAAAKPAPAAKKPDPKKKAGAGNQKKKVVDDEVLFSKVLAHDKIIGEANISIEDLFAGTSEISGDYPFVPTAIPTAPLPPDGSNPGALAVLRISLLLNPGGSESYRSFAFPKK